MFNQGGKGNVQGARAGRGRSGGAGGQYVEEQKRPRPAALPRAGRRRGSGRQCTGDRRPGRTGAGGMGPVAPPSTVTTPPRDFGPDAPPNVYFWDPDVIAIDPSFNGLAQPNAPIQRLWTGRSGPRARPGTRRAVSWSGATSRTTGRCAGSRTTVTCPSSACRRTTATATPSTSRAGRSPASISRRRVVRYELDGSSTVIAEFVQGQAAELAQRRRSPSGRQHLVHRPAIRRPDLRGRSRRGRRPEQSRRAG